MKLIKKHTKALQVIIASTKILIYRLNMKNDTRNSKSTQLNSDHETNNEVHKSTASDGILRPKYNFQIKNIKGF